MPKTTPASFIKEVRQEMSKVTWPTRKETVMSTVMVFILAIIAAIFFFFADASINFIVRQVLSI